MNEWFQFVTDNGLTREYFDTEVKEPLSKIMQLYQLRTLDKQDEFTNFLTDTSYGLAGMVAGSAFADLTSGNYPGTTLEEILNVFPPYQDLVEILKGTATEADIDDFVYYLTDYMGDYADYEATSPEAPAVSEVEFVVIKENAPKLVRALAPIIVADAKYTQDAYGDNASLYYTYTLGANAEKLLIGHIPENIMPILKSLIPAKDEPEDTPEDTPENTDVPVDDEMPETPEDAKVSAPNAGALAANRAFSAENQLLSITAALCVAGAAVWMLSRRLRD